MTAMPPDARPPHSALSARENARLAPFFSEIESACGRIRSMEEERLLSASSPTEYVLLGRTYTLASRAGVLPFWCGVNVKRLFFIAYNACEPERAEELFTFCFGGAQSVGWSVNYERVKGGVSIWATRYVDESLSETTVGADGQEAFSLSEAGLFWATDIAMMAQSWTRTCERHGVKRIFGSDPAPL